MTESDRVTQQEPVPADASRYRCLGLVANPFVRPADTDDDPAVASEVAAMANLLLREVWERSRDEAPKPLLIRKGEVPSQYPLLAMAGAEYSFANDESLNVLHAYVPLFTMRIGAARATLNVLAERLAFRDFEGVLAGFIKNVLANPDESLGSYVMAGPDRLSAFGDRFAEDSMGAIRKVFGDEVLERHAELAGVADLRHSSLPFDTDETEDTPEVDDSIGSAPGTPMIAATAEQDIDEDDRAIFEYVVEYASVHLSTVVARALRVRRDRGLAAFSEELKVTKAPRKTLLSLLRLASLKYEKVVFLYDGFESWLEIGADVRSAFIGILSELRWKTAGSAFPVFALSSGEAPEIEESFGASGTIDWDFPGLFSMQDHPGEFIEEVASNWTSAAALGDSGLRIDDPVLAVLREAAGGSMSRFVIAANAAVEDAANRSIPQLDEVAKAAGMSALEQ